LLFLRNFFSLWLEEGRGDRKKGVDASEEFEEILNKNFFFIINDTGIRKAKFKLLNIGFLFSF